MPGQKAGAACSANTEVCLGCQNLVITLDDIKKYFCFINFHNYLLRAGGLTEIEYGKAVSEKRFIWESYILKKYDAGVVERIRSSALSSPVPEWDVSLYEGGYE
ncbi:integrase [Pseudomonas aeruginosa]|nr:integrase [Pseudomonas aeruginosa]